MTETIFLEKQSPGYEETSGNDQADHSEERRIPTFEVDAVILRSLMRMQTGFEMKTLARTAEKGANNLLHSISLNSSFVAALEEQLNNLLDFTRRHVAEVRTRLKLSVATKEELYHLGDVLLSLQSTLIRGLQDLRDLADVFDNLNGNSNAASDFLQSLDVLEKKNRVEDDITSELATLYSLLKDTSTKSKLLRRGTISGETRKQKHGYHVIGSPILLVAMWLVLLLTSLFASGRDNLDLMIRFFRGQYLVVTYAYLLGLSMLGWAKARIDYVHEHLLPMGTVTPSHVFSTAGALTVLFGALMFLFLVLSAFIESVGLLVFFAFIKWLLLAVFLFNPLDVLNRGARFFFVKHTSQVILSPLFPVLFSHVWYTDQLLSLVAVGLDLQYQICYFIVGSWFPGTPLGTCSSSATAIRPLIASLPAMWRILQSLRCFVETRSPRHIVNSVKYITTVAVVLVSAAIELTQSSTLSIGQLLNPLLSGWVAVWGVVAAINILYSHTWDVVMDWEVVRFNSNRVPHIRRQRLYKAMLFYYFAIGSNLLFRMATSLKTTLAILRHTSHGDTIFTLLVFAELARRFMWNFLRVELQWLQIQNNFVF
eukprot:Em0080g10a